MQAQPIYIYVFVYECSNSLSIKVAWWLMVQLHEKSWKLWSCPFSIKHLSKVKPELSRIEINIIERSNRYHYPGVKTISIWTDDVADMADYTMKSGEIIWSGKR